MVDKQEHILQKLAQCPEIFPQVLLLEGIRGIGKCDLAKNLVTTLMHHDGQEDVAEFVASASHPDYLLVQCTDEKRFMNTEKIQEVTDFVCKSAVMGRYKYVIIDALDSVHYTARDAILKVLENAELVFFFVLAHSSNSCLLYTSPSPRDRTRSRMPSSA